jgi:hypothetical protein
VTLQTVSEAAHRSAALPCIIVEVTDAPKPIPAE